MWSTLLPPVFGVGTDGLVGSETSVLLEEFVFESTVEDEVELPSLALDEVELSSVALLVLQPLLLEILRRLFVL